MVNDVSLLVKGCFKDRIRRGFYIALWPTTKNGFTTITPSTENNGDCPDMPPRWRPDWIFTFVPFSGATPSNIDLMFCSSFAARLSTPEVLCYTCGSNHLPVIGTVQLSPALSRSLVHLVNTMSVSWLKFGDRIKGDLPPLCERLRLVAAPLSVVYNSLKMRLASHLLVSKEAGACCI